MNEEMIKGKKRIGFCILLVLMSSILISGCIEEDNSTPTLTPSPTSTPTLIPIETPSPMPIETPTPTPEPTPEPLITYEDLPVQKANGNPAVLINYRNAVNSTFDEVCRFLRTDKTDTYSYTESFKCVDFAEKIHNNAEAKGIRAGLVTVTFRNDPIGHALNVFNTRDRGLVFIDCTGVGSSVLKEIHKCTDLGECSECGFDKIAYIIKDKEYAAVSLDITTNTDYKFYEITKYNTEEFDTDVRSYERKLNEYERDLENYNRDVRYYNNLGPYCYTDEECRMYNEMYNELKRCENELDNRYVTLKSELENLKSRGKLYSCVWGSDNIVEEIIVYW